MGNKKARKHVTHSPPSSGVHITFSEESYTIAEEDGSGNATIQLTGQTDISLSFSFITSSDSATGKQHTAHFWSLLFPAIPACIPQQI